MMQTSQLECNNQTGSTLVLQTTLLPLLQVLNFKNCDYKN